MKHIDAVSYGNGNPRPMDEDDALEQAEAEIRRLKNIIADIQTEKLHITNEYIQGVLYRKASKERDEALAKVKCLASLVEAARETMVQHHPDCLLWLETFDLYKKGTL